MRTNTFASVLSGFLGLALVAAASPAWAQEVVGSYDVKYEEVANNCTTTGIVLKSGKLRIRQEKKQVLVDIERIPLMSGSPSKTGAVRAMSKVGPTSIEKLDGKFSVAGRVDSVLSLVLVAEYYVDKKPLCTQSWNVSGVKEGGDAKPASPAAPAATPGR